jgi:hypothetical protein
VGAWVVEVVVRRASPWVWVGRWDSKVWVVAAGRVPWRWAEVGVRAVEVRVAGFSARRARTLESESGGMSRSKWLMGSRTVVPAAAIAWRSRGGVRRRKSAAVVTGLK